MKAIFRWLIVAAAVLLLLLGGRWYVHGQPRRNEEQARAIVGWRVEDVGFLQQQPSSPSRDARLASANRAFSEAVERYLAACRACGGQECDSVVRRLREGGEPAQSPCR